MNLTIKQSKMESLVNKSKKYFEKFISHHNHSYIDNKIIEEIATKEKHISQSGKENEKPKRYYLENDLLKESNSYHNYYIDRQEEVFSILVPFLFSIVDRTSLLSSKNKGDILTAEQLKDMQKITNELYIKFRHQIINDFVTLNGLPLTFLKPINLHKNNFEDPTFHLIKNISKFNHFSQDSSNCVNSVESDDKNSFNLYNNWALSFKKCYLLLYSKRFQMKNITYFFSGFKRESEFFIIKV